ncbi:Crp/Fnr family transcriptional regulator [Parvularcula dongshanensis]|uniref:CRP-like cAMP-binding protein n=1 Tax=Parvularcula dongshanensis TaxID=1173995 RepID=A0A840I7P5_9PROT|nr:Crp/Fnr family transcriptional regulator [Parvularcula dongshanensis]MBB4660128.1 CRP-like cAMP-binding protein [Parvularcula dongshanensis]
MPYDAEPLRRRLNVFETISDEAKRALMDVLGPTSNVRKGDQLRQVGGPAVEFWIVEQGWFFDCSTLGDGGRQVYTVYQPGDVMGLQDLGWEVAVCDTVAATDGVIVRIGKDDFSTVVAQHPALAAYFLTYGIYDHTRMIDRLRVVGRMEAVKRVGHFLLQCFSDQADPDGLPRAGRFHLPLDQSVIGDAVGLTNISVSRMMSELEKQGLIDRSGRSVHVPDVPALASFSEFTERRRAVPLSWMLAGMPEADPNRRPDS